MNTSAQSQPSAAPKSAVPDLRALLERVEAATGADHELNDAVWWRLDCLPQPGRYRQLAHRTRQENVGPPGAKADWRSLGAYTQPPPLTASIDAALALVERVLPEWATDVHTFDGTPETYPLRKDIVIYDDGECEVTLSYCHPKIEPRQVGVGFAKTPPLAILAALLKAKIALADQSVGNADDAAQVEDTPLGGPQ